MAILDLQGRMQKLDAIKALSRGLRRKLQWERDKKPLQKDGERKPSISPTLPSVIERLSGAKLPVPLPKSTPLRSSAPGPAPAEARHPSSGRRATASASRSVHRRPDQAARRAAGPSSGVVQRKGSMGKSQVGAEQAHADQNGASDTNGSCRLRHVFSDNLSERDERRKQRRTPRGAHRDERSGRDVRDHSLGKSYTSTRSRDKQGSRRSHCQHQHSASRSSFNRRDEQASSASFYEQAITFAMKSDHEHFKGDQQFKGGQPSSFSGLLIPADDDQ